MLRKYALWLVFAAFVAAALAIYWRDGLFVAQGAYANGKYVVWITFAAFTAYSFYCTQHENLFKTVGVMGRLHWGRQIGLDLYIGLALFVCLIALVDPSPAMVLFWVLPILIYANQATLLYLALNYETIVARLAG